MPGKPWLRHHDAGGLFADLKGAMEGVAVLDPEAAQAILRG